MALSKNISQNIEFPSFFVLLVLHRVHYLFENLMAPKLIAHTVSGALPDEESTNDTPNLHHQKVCQRPTETTWSIERTIAQLLFFLASDQSTTIREDLVQLLMDLAVLAQCDDNMLASSDIQLELFPKTMEELWSEAGDEDDEFVLDIHNRDCILSLQSATLNVLIEWNKQCLAKIIPRVDESNDAVEESTETLDLSSQFSNDSKRDVLAALRPILLGESVSILAERSRSSALELLLHSGLILPRIDMDSNAWSAANGIELDILLEAGLLTVKAVGKLLLRQEQWKQYACKEESLAQSEDVAVGLALLLRQCVLLPPRVSGYCHSEVQDTVCRTSLQSLLDECLPWIRPRGEKHVLVQVQQLEIVTLRTIHACLHANLESRNAFFLSNPIHVVGPLLDLLSEYSSEICDVAVFILRDLLITLSIKVDDLCESVWSHRHSTPQQLWVPQIPPQLKGYCPSSSSKRCDASPMKSSSPVSTSDGNGGRKGKRRTSIFDSSPLSIVSPAAKRLKDTNANQETEACSATPTTETGALSYFVEDLLRSFLISSLQASQRISEYAMSCSSGRIEDPCLPKLDIPHVVASLKVLLVQNAIVSPTQSDNHQPYDYSHPENEVLKRLASGWQEYCYSIATQAEKGSAGWTKEWQALSNVVISCGLFGWYTTRSYRSSSVSPELVEIFISGSLTSSNALALVATAVSNNEKSQNKPTNRSLCRGLCKDIQDGLAFATWGSGTTLMGSHLCPCSLISLETESKAQQHFDDLFQHDCTIMTFLSFPLPIRYVSLGLFLCGNIHQFCLGSSLSPLIVGAAFFQALF